MPRNLKRKWTGKQKKAFKKTKYAKKAATKPTFKRKYRLGGTGKRMGTAAWRSNGSFGRSLKSVKLNGLQKLQAPQYSIIQSSGIVNVNAAGQKADLVSTYYLGDDLTFILEQIAAGTQLPPTVAGTPGIFQDPRMYKYLLESVKVTTQFTNQSNGNCYMDIYDISVRKPNPNYTPLTAWSNGLAQQGVVVGGTLGAPMLTANYGITPFMSRQFCELYKVDKVTTVNLAAGETHLHTVFKKLNHVFDPTQLITSVPAAADMPDLNSTLQIAGLTHYQMIVVRGQATDVTTTPGLTGVTTPDIDYVNSKVYKTQLLGGGRSQQAIQVAGRITGIAGLVLQAGSGAATANINA